jgi:hypothetical protein
MPYEGTLYFPTDDKPLAHKILHTEDDPKDRRKARAALQEAHASFNEALGVSRSPNPKIDAEPVQIQVFGNREYAIYKLKDLKL